MNVMSLFCCFAESVLLCAISTNMGLRGRADLVQQAGGALGVSFGFYLREAFQSQTHTEIIQEESLGTDML